MNKLKDIINTKIVAACGCTGLFEDDSSEKAVLIY